MADGQKCQPVQNIFQMCLMVCDKVVIVALDSLCQWLPDLSQESRVRLTVISILIIIIVGLRA